jgi:hypothetical protein
VKLILASYDKLLGTGNNTGVSDGFFRKKDGWSTFKT